MVGSRRGRNAELTIEDDVQDDDEGLEPWTPPRQDFVHVLKHVAGLCFVTALMYVGETGQDGGLVRDVWTAAKTASPFAAMFSTLAWLAERRERIQAQRQCYARTIDFVKSTNMQTNTIARVVDVMNEIARGLHILAAQVGIRLPRQKR